MMYSRCPHCRTVFSVTEPQLAARGGVVKCGHCARLFRADHYLTRELPRNHSYTPTDTAVNTATATSDAKVVPISEMARQHLSEPTHEDSEIEEIEAARPPPAPATSIPDTQIAPAHTDAGADPVTRAPLPTLQELLHGPARAGTRRWPWLLACLTGALVLTAQGAYFYANELSQWQPATRPWLSSLCNHLKCSLRPMMEPRLIELSHTAIAPHQKYANALELRATLINRADFIQPYPVMEVSITNRDGTVIGRRSFRPENYLEKLPAADEAMVPNVIVEAELAFTLPDTRADGYEIRLLADPKLILSP